MAWKLFRSFLGSEKKPSDTQSTETGLNAIATEGALRFERWMQAKDIDVSTPFAALDQVLIKEKSNDLSDALLSDAASYLGQKGIERFGGSWDEDPLFGPVVLLRAGECQGCLRPMSIVEKRLEIPRELSVARFAGLLPKRLKQESELSFSKSQDVHSMTESLRGLSGGQAQQVAVTVAETFRQQWGDAFGQPLALSLNGVRELDRFLRTNYLICFLREEDLIRAGFFVGEVCRGLFQGEWDFRRLDEAPNARLCYPELDYKPIGRIFKMMVACWEGESLDEYIRLVPSARKELQRQQREG